MVKSEMSKILTVIAACYANFEISEYKTNLWFSLLGDIDYQVATLAIKKLVMTNKFAPSIAEIREACSAVMNGKSVSAGEAWGSVQKLICIGSCRYDPPERLQELVYNQLDETTAKVVKWIGWKNICEAEELSVIRGQFMKIYVTEIQRTEERKSLPPELLEKLEMLANKFSVKSLKVIEGGK